MVTEKQKKLTDELINASNAYYNHQPIMSDMEFDRKVELLSKLEEESGVVLENSPTHFVGSEVVDVLERSKHETPALSLDKVKYVNREKLVDWLGDKNGVLSWKMDGLTIVATYDNGDLTKAVTRGNGTEGSVITHNARFFKGLPWKIPYNGHLVVRGECTMTNKEFERINDESNQLYENARNLASATVQMLDANESRKREIVFTAFKLVQPFNASESKGFDWLKSLGFNVVEYEVVSKDTIMNAIESWKNRVVENESPTDGLVLSYDDAEYAERLGNTGHHPRGSIAMKWTDELVESTVREIEWSVGKTGAITPVAVFDTVRLGLGSNVNRASLHNLAIMQNMPSFDGGHTLCGVGSKVQVYMANMIIPQIYSCTTGHIEIPSKCPVCGGQVDTRNGQLFCVNPDCSVKNLKKFATFVSKDGMDIDGLSEAKIQDLLEMGYLTRFSDFYTLKMKDLSVLRNRDGWGEKSVQNLLDAIEKSRNTSLNKFLYALSIPLVGHDLSKKLSTYFDDVSAFVAFVQSPESLSTEEGIGPVKSAELTKWCEKTDVEELECLISFLIFEKKETEEQTLKGLTFVITGTVNRFKNRDSFKQYVEERGGKVAGSVSTKTTYLVNNDTESTSGKNKKAKELNIPILSEDDFIEKFGFV